MNGSPYRAENLCWEGKQNQQRAWGEQTYYSDKLTATLAVSVKMMHIHLLLCSLWFLKNVIYVSYHHHLILVEKLSVNVMKLPFSYQLCFVCTLVCSIVKMHGMNQLILTAQIITSPQCMGPIDTEIKILSMQPDSDSHNKWGHSDDVLCFHQESIHGISFSILCFQRKKQDRTDIRVRVLSVLPGGAFIKTSTFRVSTALDHSQGHDNNSLIFV